MQLQQHHQTPPIGAHRLTWLWKPPWKTTFSTWTTWRMRTSPPISSSPRTTRRKTLFLCSGLHSLWTPLFCLWTKGAHTSPFSSHPGHAGRVQMHSCPAGCPLARHRGRDHLVPVREEDILACHKCSETCSENVFPKLLEELTRSWKDHPYGGRSSVPGTSSLDCEAMESRGLLWIPLIESYAAATFTRGSPRCPRAAQPSPQRWTHSNLR